MSLVESLSAALVGFRVAGLTERLSTAFEAAPFASLFNPNPGLESSASPMGGGTIGTLDSDIRRSVPAPETKNIASNNTHTPPTTIIHRRRTSRRTLVARSFGVSSSTDSPDLRELSSLAGFSFGV